MEQKEVKLHEGVDKIPSAGRKTYSGYNNGARKTSYNSKKNYKIVSIGPNYITVEDKNGCNYRKYGSFSDVKIGDSIEI